jgi:hypothetical protein
MTDRIIRLGGIAAVVFVVLILITAFAPGSPPSADDTVTKLREFLVDHRGTLLFSNFLALIAVPFVLWFGVVFREVVRGDRTSSALGTFSLAGLLITAPAALIGGALSVAPVYVDGAAERVSDDTLQALFSAQSLCFGATSAGIAAFALGAGLAIRRTGVLPAYTMWLAFLAVLGNIVAMFSTLGAGASNIGFTGLLTFALFLLVTGITMAAGKVAPVLDAPLTARA